MHKGLDRHSSHYSYDKETETMTHTRKQAFELGQADYAKGLTLQQNPYFKSVNGLTPAIAYDWEAGYEFAKD